MRPRFALLVSLSLISVSIACFVDEPYKMKYLRNKVILITGLITDYKNENGHLPNSIKDLSTSYSVYLREHPDMAKKYLNTQWSSRHLQIDEVADNYSIKYYLNNATTYYLCGYCGVSNDADTLNRLIKADYGPGSPGWHSKGPSFNMVVHNGVITFCLTCSERSHINLERNNLTKYMIEYRYTGHTVND